MKANTAKANWFVALSKLPLKKRCEVICCAKTGFFKDLGKLVKHVGRKKGIRLESRHKKLFSKHKSLLKKIVSHQRAPKKLKKFLLKRLRGGAFPLIPIIGSLLPSLVNLAVTELPKLFG